MFDEIKHNISITPHAYGFKAVRWSLTLNNLSTIHVVKTSSLKFRILKAYSNFLLAMAGTFQLFPYFTESTLTINETTIVFVRGQRTVWYCNASRVFHRGYFCFVMQEIWHLSFQHCISCFRRQADCLFIFG